MQDLGTGRSRSGGPQLRPRLPLLIIIGLAAGCSPPAEPVASNHPVVGSTTSRPTAEVLESSPAAAASNPGYLGHQVCAECHAERVEEFQQTNHFRACREPAPDDMPPVFSKEQGTLRTRYPDIRFEMSQQGADYYQTVVRTTSTGEQRATTRIDLIYGAGDADEVYLSWHADNGLYELPVVWIHTENCWGASHFSSYGAGDLSRPLTLRCVECHNAWVEHVPGTLNQYKRQGAVLGVNCECCHGPGREHVTFHRAHPEAEAAHGIVHPGHLSRERQIEVCTQCHSNVMTHRGPAFAYRPGEPLADYYRTGASSHPEDDHVANQIQYLRDSPCFQQSDMTCTTCHDPHRRLGVDGSPSHSCMTCHAPDDCHERERLPEGMRDDCTSCHMPRNVKINVNFQTADDDYLPPIRRSQHRIGIYPAATKEVWRQWHLGQSDPGSRREAERLTQELVDYWLAEAEAYRQQRRLIAAIAAMREAVRLDPSPKLRDQLRATVAVQTQLADDWAKAQHLIAEKRVPEAIETLTAILQTTPDDAKAHGRLGTLYAMSDQRSLALVHLKKSAALDADDPYAFAMLGWLAYLDGQPEEALDYYGSAQIAEPYNAKLHYQMGLALAQLERMAEASESFRQALQIQPDHVEACAGLNLALRASGKPREALPYARRNLELTRREQLPAWMALVDTCLEAGQVSEALDALEQACQVAERSAPAQAPALRARLEQLRSRVMEKRPE